MSQIDELQSRIARALDRIAVGLETLPDNAALTAAVQAAAASVPAAAPEIAAPAVDNEEIERLRAELDDEKMANAQLEERMRTLREQIAAGPAEFREQLAAQRDAMAALDGDLQRLRKANEALMENNAALRTACERGVGEPHLINKAMLVELEGIRAARAAEAAETRALHDTLKPLLTEASAGQGGAA